MKYAVILGDGMADYPVKELGHKTPLQKADIPSLDSLCARGVSGMVQTVPAGMPPGSDTANLSVLGYDPRKYYSGRSPFEAASIGVELKEGDIAFRCNLVTLSEAEPYGEKTMVDHSAGEITTEEAGQLINSVGKVFGGERIAFYRGISYRHLMVWQEGPFSWQLTPPHDILGKKIFPYLPQGEGCKAIREMMEKSVELLSNHAVNAARKKRGLNMANALWLWGEGKKPELPNFFTKYGLKGSMISAVDLLKGLGLYAGMKIIEVPGATGTLDTDYEGKVKAALEALEGGLDFVYIHVEAPDECGHRQESLNKVKAIEYLDKRVVKPLQEGLIAKKYDYKLMVLPDHATPLSLRTHTSDAVPFVIYDSTKEVLGKAQSFTEAAAAGTGFFIEQGHALMDYFISGAR